MDGPALAIVRSARDWARAVHRYVADYGGAIVRVRPLEERQAIDEDYDILLIDDTSSFLSNRLVHELHSTGRKLIGVYDSTDIIGGIAAGRERLEQMGFDATIDSSSSPEEFLRVIQSIAPSHTTSNHELQQMVDEFRAVNGNEDASDIDVSETHHSEGTAPQRRDANAGRGKVTLVISASGGAGSTEVAIEMARQVRLRGEVGVVVDGDDMSPSIAQRLSLPLHPNIRTAIDAVEHHVGRLADAVMAGPGNQVIVLCGLPHPKDWMSVRPDEVYGVIDALKKVCHHVVVNTTGFLDDLAGIGGVDRFGVARTLVETADSIVIVGASNPVGVTRILDRVADIHSMTESTPIHLVVNRMPASNAVKAEIVEELQRTFVPKSMHFIPLDKRVEEAAWRGELVANGPFVSHVEELILAALGAPAARKQSKNKKPIRQQPRPTKRVG